MTDTDRLAALLDNRQMPDSAKPDVTLGELRALRDAIAAGVTLAPTPPDALREAAQALFIDPVTGEYDPHGWSCDNARADALRAALREGE